MRYAITLTALLLIGGTVQAHGYGAALAVPVCAPAVYQAPAVYDAPAVAYSVPVCTPAAVYSSPVVPQVAIQVQQSYTIQPVQAVYSQALYAPIYAPPYASYAPAYNHGAAFAPGYGVGAVGYGAGLNVGVGRFGVGIGRGLGVNVGFDRGVFRRGFINRGIFIR